MNIIISILTLIFSIFLYKENSEAATVLKSVFCVDKNKNWHWLKNKDKEQVYIYVLEKYAIKHNINAVYGEVLWWKIKYSIPFAQHPEKVISELQAQCKEQYGINFEYAQPAVNIFSIWEPFGVNDEKIAKGVYQIDFNIIAIKNSLITLNQFELSFNQDKSFMNMSELLVNTFNERTRELYRYFNTYPF